MSDPRLSSPRRSASWRPSAAAVASLGVVALGVQLGTSGLVGEGPGRNPGSTSATPASATVELRRSAAGATLDQQLIALAPGARRASAFGSSCGLAPSRRTPPPTSDAVPAPAPAPADGGTAPARPRRRRCRTLPVPAPIPTPPTPVPTPTPTIPAPAPTIPPALEPVVEPVIDVLAGLGVAESARRAGPTSTAPASTAPTLDGLIRPAPRLLVRGPPAARRRACSAPPSGRSPGRRSRSPWPPRR